ncbi:MAG: methyltransferase domain-containing protein [bacterium]|nr:methyltransferase domain-containing protein [bacterium]
MSDETRRKVSEVYRKAIRKSRERCGSTADERVVPAGTAAKLAGYTTELTSFGDAASSSFGCGNPLAFAGVREGDTVVDLGSGAGLDLLIAAEMVGASGRVIGVDMTDEMLEAARESADKAGFTNVEVRKGWIEELPIEDGRADWVVSNCVINLSPEKERVFAEIHRVLKPGGRFSISDIVAEDLAEFLREHAAVYAACIGGAISETEYVAGLQGAGLVEVNASERLFYEPEVIERMIGSDCGCSGESSDGLTAILPSLQGKVTSVRFSGRRP